MDEGHAPGQAGAEAQGIVGAVDVVLDSFGDGDDGHALLAEASRIDQHIDVAHDDQSPQPQPVYHIYDVLGQVLSLPLRLAQKLRYLVAERLQGVEVGGM